MASRAAIAIDSDDASELNHGPRQSYRSWKKKYNKMRHTFKETMGTNTGLFEEEDKLNKVARRLQEQNDQIIDLLASVNECRRLPPAMHYDLRSPTPSESSVPPLIHDMPKTSLKDAKATMHEMKNELKNELITLEEYNELFISLRSSLGPPKSLSDLERIPHSTLAIVSPGELPTDINDDPLTGYLSPSHEEEYLAALDASIDGLPLNIESHPIRDLKRDSETPIKNPVSVYNWLRRNQPQVFLQDADTANSYGEQIVAGVSGAPEKSTPAHTGTRKGARASKVAVEEEVVDDEGNVITVTSATTRGGRGKRKREDDAYRPKGGTGRQTRKRMSVGRGAAD